jgi:hypothetical protein
MAVPTSGVLTLEGIAQEALYGTYGTGVITPPIHLYDLVNGGDSAGSGNSYPTVNDGCTPNPVDRIYSPVTVSNVSLTQTVYTTTNPSTSLSIGDILYKQVAGGGYVPYNGGGGFIYNSAGDTFFGCPSPGGQYPGGLGEPIVSVNSSGVITSTSCYQEP